MIVDTSALLAFFNDREPAHRDVVAVIEASPGPFVVSPMVLAELDYLVATRIGVDAELVVLAEMTSGAWEIASWSVSDTQSAAEVIAAYRDQNIGLADAGNIVLAARYGTRTIATLDRRHFTVLRAADGGVIEVVP